MILSIYYFKNDNSSKLDVWPVLLSVVGNSIIPMIGQVCCILYHCHVQIAGANKGDREQFRSMWMEAEGKTCNPWKTFQSEDAIELSCPEAWGLFDTFSMSERIGKVPAWDLPLIYASADKQ